LADDCGVINELFQKIKEEEEEKKNSVRSNKTVAFNIKTVAFNFSCEGDALTNREFEAIFPKPILFLPFFSFFTDFIPLSTLWSPELETSVFSSINVNLSISLSLSYIYIYTHSHTHSHTTLTHPPTYTYTPTPYYRLHLSQWHLPNQAPEIAVLGSLLRALRDLQGVFRIC
jgi:hypothetical protein